VDDPPVEVERSDTEEIDLESLSIRLGWAWVSLRFGKLGLADAVCREAAGQLRVIAPGRAENLRPRLSLALGLPPLNL
jgi:hypothetical protein